MCSAWFIQLLVTLAENSFRHWWPAVTIRKHDTPAFNPCTNRTTTMLFHLERPTCTRLGGLGLHDPSVVSSECFQSSEHITAGSNFSGCIVDPNTTSTIKKDVKKRNRQKQDEQAHIVHDQLTPQLKQCMDLSKEKGSSSWLSVLRLEEHGFCLRKGEFRDTLSLRYGWKLNSAPQTCNCGA